MLDHGLHATALSVRLTIPPLSVSPRMSVLIRAMSRIDRRVKSARYITAAVAAVFVVSTLYYIQTPALSRGLSSDSFNAPWDTPATAKPWQRPVAPSSPIWDDRAAQVKDMYRHAYSGYLKHAAGFDELLPLSNSAINKYVCHTIFVAAFCDAPPIQLQRLECFDVRFPRHDATHGPS